MSSLKKSILGGMFWTTFETVINRGLGFVIQLILARMLFPADFGLVGMAVVFISFIEVFNDLGMNAALIQKKDEHLTPLHYDTAFWTGIVWSIFLYFLIFFLLTPLAASFYHEQKLMLIMPVLSISILISPINLVHRAQLIKAMNFKKLAFVNNLSNIASGIIALILVFTGFGVWSLVFYSITKVVVALPFYFKATKWTPKLRWDKKVFKEIFGFGAYTTFTSLTAKITGNIDYLLVGKFIGASALGFYTFAFLLTDVVRDQIIAIVNKVIYPVYAKMQDDRVGMTNMFLKVVAFNNLVVYPIMLAIFLFSEDLLPIFFGNKWASSIPIIKILCFAVFIQMLNNSHTALLRAAGEVRLELLLQVIKSIGIFVPLISIGIYFYGTLGAAGGYTIGTFLAVSLSFYYMYKVFKLNPLRVFGATKASGLMLIITLPTILLLKNWLDWRICFIIFVALVLGTYYLFAKNQIMQMIDIVKNRSKSK